MTALLADDDTIPLTDAPALLPHARLKLATLRAEAARGRLKTFRVGRRVYLTSRDLRDMLQACRDAARHPASL
jgi:hypothetical protein